MDNKSKPEERFIQELENERTVPQKYLKILAQFVDCYRRALDEAGLPFEQVFPHFLIFLKMIKEQFQNPFQFEPYHKKIREPDDYYRFGIEFIRPLVDREKSRAAGLEHFAEIEKQIQAGENAILFANHQTETDPQAISLLLEKTYPKLAEKIIYVAGERVVTDPLAIPFSMGCDLLCIYSKRYIDHPPELKEEKLVHNKNTMSLMSQLLKEGGKIIYVAPSGGRDRKRPDGTIEIAPFDPQSIEMFYLMSKKAKTPTHFYPLMLGTYEMLPPPETVQKELGEARSAKYTPIFLCIDQEFDMEKYSGSDAGDKIERRKNRAKALWNIVSANYKKLIEGS